MGAPGVGVVVFAVADDVVVDGCVVEECCAVTVNVFVEVTAASAASESVTVPVSGPAAVADTSTVIATDPRLVPPEMGSVAVEVHVRVRVEFDTAQCQPAGDGVPANFSPEGRITVSTGSWNAPVPDPSDGETVMG